MQITRFATIELNRPAPSRLGRWTLRASNGVEVIVDSINGADDITTVQRPTHPEMRVAWPYENTSARLAVRATVSGGPPEVGDDQLVVIPDAARRLAEAALIEYGDLLAVTYRCRRVLRSPKPCVALVGESPEEQELLDRAVGIAAPFLSRPRVVQLPELGPHSPIGAALSDRLDGLALLADALSEDSAVGQVHNLFRLIERGFAKGPHDCIDPLLKLLQTGPAKLGWTSEEVGDWFLRLRPEMTHADRRQVYARAPDVEPHLARIEYAAYDVLLNKATWHTSDSNRRNVIRLAAGIDSDNATLRLQRPDATLVFLWTDPFGLFPVDFSVRVGAERPSLTAMPGYTSDEDDVFTTRMRVRNDFGDDHKVYWYEVLTKHGKSPAPAGKSTSARRHAPKDRRKRR